MEKTVDEDGFPLGEKIPDGLRKVVRQNPQLQRYVYMAYVAEPCKHFWSPNPPCDRAVGPTGFTHVYQTDVKFAREVLQLSLEITSGTLPMLQEIPIPAVDKKF